MAAVSLFWGTNMAAVTSCENNLLTPTLPPSLEMSIRHSQALLWQTVDSSPFSSLYLYMFFAGFSEILRRWKAAGKLLTLLAFARVLGIYFPTVSAWY